MKSILKVFVLGVFVFIGGIVSAQSYDELEKVIATGGGATDYMGREISISGNRAIVGAHGESSYKGAAYIFEWNGSSWTQTAKLVASDGAGGDDFGESVSISGDRAIVGANGHGASGSNAGAVYVYDWNGSSWQETKIIPADTEASDRFGQAVAISGDRFIAGATGDDDATSSAGALYVYEWNGSSWVQEAKLTANDAAFADQLGGAVALDGDRAVVGVSEDDDAGSRSGGVYIYDWNGSSWVETKITASDAAFGDEFGISVSTSGSRVLVGAYGDESSTGAIYVYDWNGSSWVETKITTSDGASNDQFGLNVSISGDTLIAGSHADENYIGAAYIYNWSGTSWEESKVVSLDGEEGDEFGWGVAVGGSHVLVGAFSDDNTNGNDSGAFYVFTPSSDCTTYATTFFDTFNFYGSSSALTALGTYVYQYFYYDCESKSFQYGNESSALTTAPDTSSKQGTTTEIATINTNKTAEEGKNYYDTELGTFKTGASDGSLVTLTAPTGKILDATGIAAVSDADEGDFYFNTTTGEFYIGQTNGSLAVLFTTN